VRNRRLNDLPAALEAGLTAIEASLENAAPRTRAILLKRAGDLCASMGEGRRALVWYGRAVDQYLELRDTAAAGLICRMILYVHPEAVRARCTLCWIDIAAGRHEQAATRIWEYAEAAGKAGQQQLAAQQLGWMFDAAGEGPLRERIVFALLRLGEDEHAGRLSRRHDPAADAHPGAAAQVWSQLMEGTASATGVLAAA
jgi:hypothetical protein